MPLGYVQSGGLMAARNALKDMLRQRFLDALVLRKQDELERSNRADEDTRARLAGVQEGSLGQRAYEFDQEAPTREAGVGLTRAQTGKLTQETGFAGEDRAETKRLLSLLPADVPGKVSPQALGQLKYFGGVDMTTPSGQKALYSSEDLGKQAGSEDLAAFNAGGRQVEQGTTDIRTAAQGKLIGLKAAFDQKAAGGGVGDQKSLDAVADMVLNDPDRLKDFTPTDRGKILTHIAVSGGKLQNRRMDALKSIVDQASDTLDTLEKSPGFAGAVGARGPSSLFGMLSEPLPGTNAAGYRSYIDSLKAQLTLPKLEFLRGLGQMSDREFKAMSASVTALNDRMSEVAFKKELGVIRANLNQMKARMGGGQPSPTPDPQAQDQGQSFNIGNYTVRRK